MCAYRKLQVKNQLSDNSISGQSSVYRNVGSFLHTDCFTWLTTLLAWSEVHQQGINPSVNHTWHQFATKVHDSDVLKSPMTASCPGPVAAKQVQITTVRDSLVFAKCGAVHYGPSSPLLSRVKRTLLVTFCDMFRFNFANPLCCRFLL